MTNRSDSPHHKLSHIIALAGVLVAIVGIIIGAICQLYPNEVREVLKYIRRPAKEEKEAEKKPPDSREAKASPESQSPAPTATPFRFSTPTPEPERTRREITTVTPEFKAMASKHLSQAIALIDVIRHSPKESEALVAICEGFAALGEIEKGLKLASLADSNSNKARALIPLLTAQHAAGKVPQNRDPFFKVKELAELYPNEHIKVTILAALAAAQSRVGDRGAASESITSALSMIENIDSVVGRAEALSEIGVAQNRIGDKKESEESLRSARQIARGHPRPYYRANVLADVALAQGLCGDSTDSKSTFNEAISIARKLKPTEADEIIRDIAQAMARTGVTAAATELAQDIKDSLNKRWAFAVIKQYRAKELARQRAPWAAENLIGTLAQEDQCFGLIAIAFGLLGIDEEPLNLDG